MTDNRDAVVKLFGAVEAKLSAWSEHLYRRRLLDDAKAASETAATVSYLGEQFEALARQAAEPAECRKCNDLRIVRENTGPPQPCSLCAASRPPALKLDEAVILELLAFALRCSAQNPAAIGGARNEAVAVLEKIGVTPRDECLFFHSHEADLRDAAEALAQAEPPSGPSRLEVVRGANRDCEFCRKPLHYGSCEELTAARRKAIAEGRGRPVPITRAGP